MRLPTALPIDYLHTDTFCSAMGLVTSTIRTFLCRKDFLARKFKILIISPTLERILVAVCLVLSVILAEASFNIKLFRNPLAFAYHPVMYSPRQLIRRLPLSMVRNALFGYIVCMNILCWAFFRQQAGESNSNSDLSTIYPWTQLYLFARGGRETLDIIYALSWLM